MSIVNDRAVADAADRLWSAATAGVPTTPVRDLIGPVDVTAAYAAQQINTQRRVHAGARIVGRKIGLTSTAVQEQLGVDQPDFGVLFADMHYDNGAEIPAGTLLQPKVEAEIAFILAEDLDAEDIDASAAARAVDYATPALEIVDSRIADWDITFADTVADNASSGAFVLGDARLGLDRYRPVDSTMTMRVNDAVASTGQGAACLGDPLEALAWLARTAHDVGEPLRAGQIILSGALGPMAPVVDGSTVEAEISGLGTVSISFAAQKGAASTTKQEDA